ncbi:hypothetical protein PINS_up013104 [Pythium insidiosum]|nr:hypothetical protein PINS_up013104 [Pythium insidiosum]
MYRSQLDDAAPALEFEFDPLRPCHAHADATLRWPEYPYKQVVIDRLRAKFLSPPLSEDAAAGALLLARGDITRAVFEVEQHYRYDEHGEEGHGGRPQEDATSNGGWLALETRFRRERDAFRAAKRAFIRGESQKVAATLDAFAARQRDAEEREALEAWKRRQFVKRYDNGDKYEGEMLDKSGVLVPHGQGTLSVPLQSGLSAAIGEIKRIPRYVGTWVDGMRHGRGKVFWRNGDAWEGTFRRDELQGKGVFSFGLGDDDEWDDTLDSSRERERETRVRYYDASQHVCWGDELALGRRLRLFDSRRYGDPLAAVVRRQDVALEAETEFVILGYDEKTDRHLLRRDGCEDTRWVSLENVCFRLLPSRPITRLDLA